MAAQERQKIGRTVGESQPYWPDVPKRPKGAPNLLVILFDDVGFSDFGCYGSPIATPTNLMVMGPGGYTFSDYWKLGLPLLIWFFLVSVFFVPLVWRF